MAIQTAPVNTLGFTGNQSVPIDSTLKFSHPQVSQKLGDLWIRSGAHSIKWSYELNTAATPTVGGEVVQILGCFVGPITIQGEAVGYQTSPNKIADPTRRPGWAGYTPTNEAIDIITWFLEYMHQAGGQESKGNVRNQSAAKLSYPARGWEFWIQVTNLEGFDFNANQVTVPWSITAEVVSDAGLDYFEGATMNSFTDDLTSRSMLAQAISPGYDFSANPFINPALNDPGGLALANRLGDNFQSLIASWAGANFMTWGFNPLGDPGDLLSQDPYSTYQSLFGGQYVGDMKNWPSNAKDVQGRGFAVATDQTNTASAGAVDASPTEANVVCAIIATFAGTGIPARLAIASSLVETGGSLDPDDRQKGGDYAIGLFQTFPAGAGGGQSHSDEVKAAWAPEHRSQPVTKYYAPSHQIQDAKGWWLGVKGRYGNLLTSGSDDDLAEYAYHAQRPGDQADYEAKVKVRLLEADKKIKASNCGGSSSAAGLSAVQKKILTFIQAAEAGHNWTYLRGGSGGRSVWNVSPGGVVTSDCSGYTALCWYAGNGRKLPGNSDAQGALGRRIYTAGGSAPTGGFEVGDLCIYPDHVTIVSRAGTVFSALVSSHGGTGSNGPTPKCGPESRQGVNYRGNLEYVVRLT